AHARQHAPTERESERTSNVPPVSAKDRVIPSAREEPDDEPVGRPAPFSSLPPPLRRGARPAVADISPGSPPPPLDLDLPPPDGASFTLDLPGPDVVGSGDRARSIPPDD